MTLCSDLVQELQKRRRDITAAKHPEARYKEIITDAVNTAPSRVWATDHVDLDAVLGQYWYELASTVEQPEYVQRVFVHSEVDTGEEQEIIGRWTAQFGNDGNVYLGLDEAIYDGCILRVEYRKPPAFPVCDSASTMPVDREWALCHAVALLLMEADLSLESMESIDRDLQYWDARRVAREAMIAPKKRTAKVRTLPSAAYKDKRPPCGDTDAIVDGGLRTV
jgi:hypothetical protein